MSKCSACGFENLDGANVCANCGNVMTQGSAMPNQPVGEQPMYDPNFMNQQPKKKNTGLIVGLIIGAVAIIVAIVIVCVLFLGKGGSGSYEAVVDNFEDAINDRDVDKLFGLFPLSDEASDLIDAYLTDDVKESFLDQFESTFGDEGIEIEIVDATQLSQDELDDVAENGAIASSFGMLTGEEYKLTDGYEVECEVSCNGESRKASLTICEWEGSWYIFDSND